MGSVVPAIEHWSKVMDDHSCAFDFWGTQDYLRKLSKHATELVALRTAAVAG
jgi:hypothetical protein